jgi:hypothetical protein
VTESNKQDIRRIEDVTEDEIVDAIAKRGFLGIDLDDTHDGNELQQVCIDLRLASVTGPHSCDETDVDNDFAERLHELCTGLDDARLYIAISNFVMLVPREWARRLAGLREDSIAAILSGRPQPADDMTDDEIHRIAFGPS